MKAHVSEKKTKEVKDIIILFKKYKVVSILMLLVSLSE